MSSKSLVRSYIPERFVASIFSSFLKVLYLSYINPLPSIHTLRFPFPLLNKPSLTNTITRSIKFHTDVVELFYP